MSDASIAGLIRDTFGVVWSPPPRLTVAEWADRYRYLSPEASAEPGLWANARAAHLVAPMEALSPYCDTERVVLKFSSQSGKSECLLNFIGFIADLDPGPILAIQPNVTPMGEAFSKDRVKPMFRDSPSLAAKMGDAKGRTSAQTITHMTFPAGHLTIAGANSPAGLASRPIRYLLCDELDRWEITKEGDPLLLARKRLQTFRARRASKELIVSSPTYDDLGICSEYDKCSQQWSWQLACQHCGATQFPLLEHFHPPESGSLANLRYVCTTCGGEHPLADEEAVKATGRWVCLQDGPADSVGFHFNQFASPFARWDDTIAEWREAGTDPAKRQVVTNTAFAMPWEGEGERADPSALAQRCEDYGAEVPDGVLALTMGVDVQGDRLELEVVGWGHRRESWSIIYQVLPGEPTSGEVWEDLLEVIDQPFERDDGSQIKIAHVCIDSGAYTQHVYEAIKRYRRHNVTPIKGAPGMAREEIDRDWRAVMKRRARRVRYGKPPEIVGVDQIKLTVFHALNAIKGQANYCHFPANRSEEYFLQLTGERLVVTASKNRRPERHWVPIHSAVEALDCRVYAYAAMLLSRADLSQPAKVAEPAPPPVTPPVKAMPPPRRATPSRRPSFAPEGWSL